MTTWQKVLAIGGVGAAAAIAAALIARRRSSMGDVITGRAGRQLEPTFDRTEGDRRVRGYDADDMTIEDKIGLLQDRVAESVKNPEMRRLALQITRKCDGRDDGCEARAIHDWVKENIRYTGDIAPHRLDDGTVDSVDLFASAQATVENGGGDCLPAGTLLLTDKHEFVPIERILSGTRIWGRNKWTRVNDVWAKGDLPVDVVHLNNGSSFRATGDHKVYVLLCPKHPEPDKNGRGCCCPIETRAVERIKVSQLRETMVLLQPERIAYGEGDLDPRRAYVEGLYLADGFKKAHRNERTGEMPDPSAFCISADDGWRKEGQKHEVEEICEALNISTNWQRKYITVKSPEWAARMQAMGTKAWEKHALSLGINEQAAQELLRGIMADSSARDRTLTTTSRELFLQARLLFRMAGITCGESFISDHKGAGTHPIWRLFPRDPINTNKKFIRVRSIDREILHLPVYDISTEDHYVYLPEADVTVSNCDEHVVLNSTLAILNGIPAQIRATSPTRWGKNHYTHVYATFGLPKNSPSRWLASDTTLPGRTAFSEEWPYKRKIDAIA